MMNYQLVDDLIVELSILRQNVAMKADRKQDVVDVIELMSNGETLQKALDLINERNRVLNSNIQEMKPSMFFYRIHKDPFLEAAYGRARQDRADLMVEEITTIADTEPDAQRARNRIDARKWVASKMQPQVYGDRLDLNVTSVVDIGAALSEAQSRVLKNRQSQQLQESQVIDITESNVDRPSGSEPDARPESGDADEFDTLDIFK